MTYLDGAWKVIDVDYGNWKPFDPRNAVEDDMKKVEKLKREYAGSRIVCYDHTMYIEKQSLGFRDVEKYDYYIDEFRLFIRGKNEKEYVSRPTDFEHDYILILDEGCNLHLVRD